MALSVFTLLLILPCINGQGFQSAANPSWGQFGGGASDQGQLMDSLIRRGWVPPADVQRDFTNSAQQRNLAGGGGGGGFGNRFDFGFSPDQLVPVPVGGVAVGDLIPVQNRGGLIDFSRDPTAANSLASLPRNVQIPDSLTQGLIDRGLLNPALVDPRLAGRGLLGDPGLPGSGFIDPLARGRGLLDTLSGRGLLDPRLSGPGLLGPTLPGAGLLGPNLPGAGLLGPTFPGTSLAEAALLNRPRVPGLINIIPGGGGLGPVGPLDPGVIGLAGEHAHHDHQTEALEGALIKNKVIGRKLKKELRVAKILNQEDRLIKGKLLGRARGIGDTNGKLVKHGDHFHVDDKIVKVVATSNHRPPHGPHHRPPPRRRPPPPQKKKNSLLPLLLGGIGALLLGK